MAEARAVRPPDRDRPAWVPLLVALLVLALLGGVLWAFLADDDDDDDSLATDDTSLLEDEPLEDDELLEEEPLEDDATLDEETDDEEPTDTATDDAATDDTATDDAASDGMAAGGPLVLVVPIPDLTGEEGRQVEVAADGIPVVDVPADEGFTVGTQDDELFVYILPEARGGVGSESDQNVEPGSILTSVEGTVEPVTDEFLSQFELIGDEEAEMIRERGFYIAATDFEATGP